MKIAFTTELPKEGFRRLEEQGFELLSASPNDGVCASLNEAWKEAEILVSTFDYKVPRDLITSMPRLQLIANFGAGYNNIDLDACRERGIRVTNTPQPVVEPTAELAFALMIDVARRVSEFDRAMRSQISDVRCQNSDDRCYPIEFGVMRNLSHSLYGKTLGIIGMGRIGQALARRALASGMKVIYHNRKPIDVLNLPYTPEVHHIIGKPELGMMKRSAYLINTARGAHVDEQALVEALKSGIIAGAAMDVYEHEPAVSSALLELPNVVLSPHTGTGTWEGRIAMCENVEDNILAFTQNQPNEMDIVI